MMTLRRRSTTNNTRHFRMLVSFLACVRFKYNTAHYHVENAQHNERQMLDLFGGPVRRLCVGVCIMGNMMIMYMMHIPGAHRWRDCIRAKSIMRTQLYRDDQHTITLRIMHTKLMCISQQWLITNMLFTQILLTFPTTTAPPPNVISKSQCVHVYKMHCAARELGWQWTALLCWLLDCCYCCCLCINRHRMQTQVLTFIALIAVEHFPLSPLPPT